MVAISYLCCSLYASLQTNEMSSLKKFYLIGCKIKNMFSGPRGIVFEEIRKDNHTLYRYNYKYVIQTLKLQKISQGNLASESKEKEGQLQG